MIFSDSNADENSVVKQLDFSVKCMVMFVLEIYP